MADLELTFLDVGHGDSTVIGFPNGDYAVVDSCLPLTRGGPPEACPAARLLMSRNVRELAFVCLSHPHSDHFSGMGWLLDANHFQVNEFWHTIPDVQTAMAAHNRGFGYSLPDEPAWEPFAREYCERESGELLDVMALAYAGRRGGRIRHVRRLLAGREMGTFGDVRVVSLGPDDDAAQSYAQSFSSKVGLHSWPSRRRANSISAVLLLEYGGNKVVLGGDALGADWRRLVGRVKQDAGSSGLLPVQCLKAPHHGARSSSYPGIWSDLLGPAQGTVVISADGGTEFPHRDVLRSIPSQHTVHCTRRAEACASYDAVTDDVGVADEAETTMELLAPVVATRGSDCCGTVTVRVPEHGVPTAAWTGPRCGHSRRERLPGVAPL